MDKKKGWGGSTEAAGKRAKKRRGRGERGDAQIRAPTVSSSSSSSSKVAPLEAQKETKKTTKKEKRGNSQTRFRLSERSPSLSLSLSLPLSLLAIFPGKKVHQILVKVGGGGKC